jgi:glycerol-3-phosphate acyltransferase PlsY
VDEQERNAIAALRLDDVQPHDCGAGLRIRETVRGITLPRVIGLLAAAAAGYLIGTVPSADTAARLATKGTTDLRTEGTGNPGAVNAMAVLGKGWGWGILVADATKGALACGVGRRLAGPAGAQIAGSAAVVGHCFPVWNGFRGGKGVAVSLGQCATTFPAYLPIDLGVAWAVGKWKGRTLPGTAAASATWVAASVLWWRRGWPNGWGPAPTAALPAGAAVSSAVILYKFATAKPGPGGRALKAAGAK